MNKIIAVNYTYDKIIYNNLYSIVNLIFLKMELDEKGFPVNYDYAEFYVVNCCLYCELCLKALNLKNGRDATKTHDLLILFDELQDDMRIKIASDTISAFGPCFDYLTPFRNLLEKEKNNFVTFRYLEFSDSTGYTCCSFLHQLSITLKNML